MFNINPLLLTDVYKMGHMEQYPSGTTKIYSYLHSRSDKKFDELVVYGLRYLIRSYLCQPIYKHHVEEFLEIRHHLLGGILPHHIQIKLMDLVKLGHFPLEIKSYPEGTILPAKSVIATVTNTHPDFYWCVGFFESLLLHTWYPITVASASRQYYKLVDAYAEMTCDNLNHLPYSVHDFGYRGVTSEEAAMVAGSAHLIHFKGTDTVPAIKLIKDQYDVSGIIGLSVPASEHSVMCSFGKHHEANAFQNMLDLYPTGVVSIVADSYDLWNALINIVGPLKTRILNRKGKVVFRPDSGNPLHILCGNPFSDCTKFEKMGVFEILGGIFGYTINSKGYKVLNPKIGVIYGDGMTYNNFSEILATMKHQGWASSNLVIGVGGLLLQSHSRDDLGLSFKATYAEIDGQPINIFKDPVTDPNKRSMTGLIQVKKENDNLLFKDNQTWEEEEQGELITVFKNGKCTYDRSWNKIRERALNS